MEDNLQRRVEMLEQKVEIALQQLREHDQFIQAAQKPVSEAKIESMPVHIPVDVAIKQDCIPREGIAPPQPKREMEISCGGPQPAERVFQQAVLDELMRMIRDASGQLIAEHNAALLLSKLLDKIPSKEYKMVIGLKEFDILDCK